jgi:hypothetical protein
MKAVIEKGYCDEDIYYSPDELSIEIERGVTFYFHPDGDLESIVPHVHVLEGD